MYFVTLKRRELWRERNTDHPRRAREGELLQRVADERLPVAHADRHRDVWSELNTERGRLRKREIGKGGAPANRFVVVAHFATSSSEGGRPPRTSRRYSGISSIEDGVP